MIRSIASFLQMLLRHHNRLDGLMAFTGVWWGLWTLLARDFWDTWTVTGELARLTGGYPTAISWTLLLAGLSSYIARRYHLDWLRSAGAAAAFVCWSLLTLVFLMVEPIYSPGVATYSLFAIAKVISYVTFRIDVDQRRIAANAVE